MEDFEKIQHRECQRQALLEELKKIIVDAEENFLIDVPERNIEKRKIFFHLVISGGLAINLMSDPFFNPLSFMVQTGGSVGTLFDFVSREIIPRITSFTPVEAEQLFLISCLLEYSALEIKRPFGHKILELSVPPGRDWFLKEIGFSDTDNLH